MPRAGSWLVLSAVLGAIVFQCFVPPEVGSADNGDFPKVIGWFSLGDPQFDAHVAQFTDSHYVFDPKFHYASGFYSSEVLLTGAAVLANRLVGQPGTFDLRVMGAVHVAVFLLSLYLLIPIVDTLPSRRRYILLALIAAVFTDVTYVAYFNSFYMDAASLLFLLLAVVAYLRAVQWQLRFDRWLLVGAAMLLVTSKMQHFLLALPIAGLLLWKGSSLTQDHNRKFGWLAAALVLSAAAFSSRSTPPEYSVFGRYTSVFYQILPHTQNVDAAMADLSLNETDRQYIGTHAYSLNAGVRDPAFADQFSQRLSYASLIRFFLLHPQDALRAIEDRLAEAGSQRPPRGNYPVSAGLVGFSVSHSFAIWSGWKARTFANHGGLYLGYAILLASLIPFGAIRLGNRIPAGMAAATATLAAMLLLEMLVAGLGDALDAARHFLLFAALTDILLLSGVYLLLIASSGPARPATLLLAFEPGKQCWQEPS